MTGRTESARCLARGHREARCTFTTSSRRAPAPPISVRKSDIETDQLGLRIDGERQLFCAKPRRQDSAMDSIDRQLEALYAELPCAKREQLCEHLVYPANSNGRMRYVTLSASALPIGSSNTVSAAKTVVGRRAKKRPTLERARSPRGPCATSALPE